MISTRRRISILMGLALGCSVMIATPSYAAQISWADWANVGGNVVGTFDDGVTVTFTPTGDLNPPAQFGAGTDTNYWATNNGIYNNNLGTDEVSNSPSLSDIIRLNGGTGNLQTLTFTDSMSNPIMVTNPVMAILSLGQDNATVDYVFTDESISILNQGVGFWGGSGTALSLPGGNILRGNEGHGVIQFTGTFSSITWTIPQTENWHGFTIGKVATVPEPASLMLLGAGLAAIGIWRRRAAKG